MSLYISLGLIILTTGIYLSVLSVNEWLFVQTEFVRGINWVYLPAGVRLLCTLLFGGAGAVGIFIASLCATFFYYFPGDWVRALAGALSSALAPYLVYRIVGARLHFQNSLSRLTPGVLMACSVGYALANVTLHHLWFLNTDTVHNPLQSAFAMFTGDLLGTFLVLYTLKLLLAGMQLFKR